MLTEVIAFGAGARDAALDDEALLTKLGEARRHLATPFAAERVNLVAGVAETLLGPRRSTASGPAAHFAFWTRRAALTKLAASFAARVPQNTLARPRGLVFHLPPQNVETVFLYSWALSYLAGNAISCGCHKRSAPGCGRSSISFSSGLRLGETIRKRSSTIRRTATLERKSPP